MGDRTNIYDLLLAFALVASAWKALFGKEAFTATVFFVVYGLFMSIAWVQLNAVDVALAEACIGAGLTGALFIGAIRQFEAERDVHVSSRGKALRIVVGVLSGFLLLGLLGAIQQLAAPVHQIPSLVDEKLGISGSTHPVTAVLLNFRAFDTWLELGVLLLASVAAIAIHQLYDEGTIPAQTPCSQEQPRLLARMMFPMLVLVGGVVLWYGSRAPGGAFQAGALLGAAGILLQIAGERSFLKLETFRLRFLLLLGFFTFLAVALFTLFTGGRILEYGPAQAGAMILVLELAATCSIALTLNLMYACSHPWRARQ